MKRDTMLMRLSICPIAPTRIQIRDGTGHVVQTIDLPMDYRLAVVRPPWWIRLRYWTRLQVWRFRGGWGSE